MGLTKTFLHPEEVNYLAVLFATLGNSTRLAILFYLKEHGPTTVSELTIAIPLAQATLSQHIKKLKKRHLIKGMQAGTRMYYSLHEDVWPILKDVLRGCGEDF